MGGDQVRLAGPPLCLLPTVSVGASSAHDMGFKGGGLTRAWEAHVNTDTGSALHVRNQAAHTPLSHPLDLASHATPFHPPQSDSKSFQQWLHVVERADVVFSQALTALTASFQLSCLAHSGMLSRGAGADSGF